MALTSLKARATRFVGLRPQRLAVLAIRAQGSTNTTAVKFKINRHVDFGQSLLIIGGAPELGSWDATKAVALSWGEGDNWSTSVALLAGSSVEYKYIIKRKDVLDWCPGQNKAVTLPLAAGVEVSDSWDSAASSVAVVAPAVAIEEVPDVPVAFPAPVAFVKDGPAAGASAASVEAPLVDVFAAPAPVDDYSAVSTVENIHVAELENIAEPPITSAAQHQQPPGFVANNIVQAVPKGAIAVGQDPIMSYEEADKYQVVEVGNEDKVLSAVATEARPFIQSMDSKTVSELRTELKRRGLSSLGNRRELITRLQNHGAI